MSLFSQLLDRAADQENYPLSSCLMQSRRLALKLSNESFRRWVDAEANGYGPSEQLPEYRLVRPGIIVLHWSYGGDDVYSGSHVSRFETDKRLPPAALETIKRVPVRKGILDLEASQESGFTCDSSIPVNQLNYEVVQLTIGMSKHSEDFNDWDGKVNQVWGCVSPKNIREILSATRARLLDFFLELMKQYPDLENDDKIAASIPVDQVARTFERTIQNFHNCNFATGDQRVATNTIHAQGSISVGGHFVMADAIDNAFNNFGGIPDPRKKVLQELGNVLKTTTSDLPTDKQQQAAEDYRHLVEQAKRPDPNNRWVKTALEGMAEVALSLAATGKPLLEVIDRVRQMFGV